MAFSKELGKVSEEVRHAILPINHFLQKMPTPNVFEFLKTAGKAAIAGVAELETSVDGKSLLLLMLTEQEIS
ncbi:hypothetical protein OFQ64_10125 [Brachyspira hyodysenteriae]|uniref:hypothetical protein n=1 Tax=Brachyspira hyodysenteriae TaxID=159 RepID=UPI0022CD2215|nr:hypothetical protein [Brachyspira hyodysenteriae]MCZ9979090.1 hypothetical protein [Brachyspira hyodysenteriae]